MKYKNNCCTILAFVSTAGFSWASVPLPATSPTNLIRLPVGIPKMAPSSTNEMISTTLCSNTKSRKVKSSKIIKKSKTDKSAKTGKRSKKLKSAGGLKSKKGAANNCHEEEVSHISSPLGINGPLDDTSAGNTPVDIDGPGDVLQVDEISNQVFGNTDDGSSGSYREVVDSDSRIYSVSGGSQSHSFRHTMSRQLMLTIAAVIFVVEA